MKSFAAILERSISYLKQNNVSKVVICGTITAKGFYEAMGFSAIGPIKSVTMRSTVISCHHMELGLFSGFAIDAKICGSALFSLWVKNSA